MANPASCAACQALPEEELLSRHIFFSPSVELAEAIEHFKAGVPDLDEEDIDVDDDDDGNNVFAVSTSEVSDSRASVSTVVPREKPRRMADLFGEIMGEAAAIKGIPH